MDHDKRIDKSIEFVAVNIAILTVSDSRKAGDDRSGDLLAGRINEDGHNLVGRAIVTDDFDAITGQLLQWVEDKGVDVIVATGGTGLTGRDGSPEAFRAIFEKEIEGLVNYSVIFHLPRLAHLRCNHVLLRVWLAEPICSRFQGRHRRAAMDGMRYYAIS